MSDYPTLPVAELDEMFAPYNPRKISDHDLEALRRSLRFFGAVDPIIVNRRSMRIVGGHQRVTAAIAEGMDELPVAWVDLDEPSEKQLNLALNRISGEWDDAALRELMTTLEESGADLTLTGFDPDELERILQSFNVEGIGGDLSAIASEKEFQQMTFTLSPSQVVTVRAAMRKSREVKGAIEEAGALDPDDDDDNENRNGNAIASICRVYLDD